LCSGQDDARSDGELVAATARGDDVAFAVLVRRYIRQATLLAAQYLGVRDEAEDVVQDAFMIVHREAPRFDVDRPFPPWFFAIVRRLASNRRARRVRRSHLLRLWKPSRTEEPVSGPTEVELVAGLDTTLATRAIKTLAPMQRACFELVAIRGLSPMEVAAMHDISESTVRQHVFRARAALRRALGETDR
jgi:RNA polymerase sigma-70 factor, ECF subfamily